MAAEDKTTNIQGSNNPLLKAYVEQVNGALALDVNAVGGQGISGAASANFVSNVIESITDTADHQILISGGVGIRNYITTIMITNAHATQGTKVKITDGATNLLCEGYAAAAGGGFAPCFSIPLKGAANSIINVTCLTNGADVVATIVGYTGA